MVPPLSGGGFVRDWPVFPPNLHEELQMKDLQLYQRLLGIKRPWRVREVILRKDAEGSPGWRGLPQVRSGEVEICVEYVGEMACPECGKRCPGYDKRSRSWRHLDTMQYRTKVVAQVPRVRCAQHGVHQLPVPWAEENSRFTAEFEALAIDWLHEASVIAVARQLGLSWGQVSGIKSRAVHRGLARRKAEAPRVIGVDETAFQRRHEYVTVVADVEHGRVLYVADRRDQAALDGYFRELGEAGCAQLEQVAMDMWPAYIASVRLHTDADVVFDKFHIAQHLGRAVDEVRRAEQRQLLKAGDDRLTGTRYVWLHNAKTMNRSQRLAFVALRKSGLKVARAWAIKEMAMSLWGYTRRGWAEHMWRRWYNWAVRSRLPTIRKVAQMIKRHWQGVINAATTNVTNAMSEGINARIQWLKRMACGYRNRESFRNAIYFHLGGLDLYPESLSGHTKV